MEIFRKRVRSMKILEILYIIFLCHEFRNKRFDLQNRNLHQKKKYYIIIRCSINILSLYDIIYIALSVHYEHMRNKSEGYTIIRYTVSFCTRMYG